MSTLHQENIMLLHSQVGRFLIVGITTVLVDFVIYLLHYFLILRLAWLKHLALVVVQFLLTLPIEVTHSKVKERGY